MNTALVIVAAGSGQRLGSSFPKAFVGLAGKPLLRHALEQAVSWHIPHSVVVVVPEGWVEPARALAQGLVLPLTVVVGGDTRTASVRQGLQALPEGATRVLIHDAARPLMTPSVFDRVHSALEAGSAAVIPVVPVVDTLVTRDSTTGATEGGVDRDALVGVQTPQGFDAGLLLAAYESVTGEFTDDAEVMRSAGHRVDSVEGESAGFKITYPQDLERAASLLGHSHTPLVGFAMDVHAFDDESPLYLAGLVWPGEKGLSGHSDGDVVIHAIVDAVLQAASLGDLGHHFGSDRAEFAGAPSSVFVEHTRGLLLEAGLVISSVGVQVVGNSPKLASRRLEAEQHLTALVGAPVSLSATTTDGLGFTGRGEGIAAVANVVLRRATHH